MREKKSGWKNKVNDQKCHSFTLVNLIYDKKKNKQMFKNNDYDKRVQAIELENPQEWYFIKIVSFKYAHVKMLGHFVCTMKLGIPQKKNKQIK